MIEPIVLGGGKSIFRYDGAALPFEPVSTVTTNTGCSAAGTSERARAVSPTWAGQ
jgi:hypothetical protein